MTKKPIIRIYTNPDEFIDREMTDEEFAQYQIDQVQVASEKAKAEAKTQAKTALLAQLGITEEEAKLLLS